MIGTGNKVAWTSENVEILTILWNAGMSAQAISEKIPYATRNSIIGKAHRLNLEPKKKNPLRIKPNQPIQRRHIVEAKRLPPTLPPPRQIQPPSGDGIPFMKSNSKTCRAVLGEALQDGHMLAVFCPTPKLEEQSYCEYHQNIYYRRDVHK